MQEIMFKQVEQYITNRAYEEGNCHPDYHCFIDAGFFNAMCDHLRAECENDGGEYSERDLVWAYDKAGEES